MDDRATIAEHKRIIEQFNTERDWDQFHNPQTLAMALSVEANEVLAHFLYKTPAQSVAVLSDEEKRREVSDELVDVYYNVLRMCQLYSIDLDEAMQRKMAKNRAKYPIEKAKGNPKKYTEL